MKNQQIAQTQGTLGYLQAGPGQPLEPPMPIPDEARWNTTLTDPDDIDGHGEARIEVRRDGGVVVRGVHGSSVVHFNVMRDELQQWADAFAYAVRASLEMQRRGEE